jgi:hypothetical protein
MRPVGVERMLGLQPYTPKKALAGTSIHVAWPTATGRHELEKTADPAKCFRPSTCSGHPMTMHFSLRIPAKPITESGVEPISHSGQADYLSERSDAGV